MTDKEIIKYLEQAIDKYNKNKIFVDDIRLDKLSLDLIKRQQAEYNNLLEQFRILDCECERLEKADENQKAEIERLKIENQSLRGVANSYKLHYNEARNEAVKEFADRLKSLGRFTSSDRYYIDKIKKEMAGDTE